MGAQPLVARASAMITRMPKGTVLPLGDSLFRSLARSQEGTTRDGDAQAPTASVRPRLAGEKV